MRLYRGGLRRLRFERRARRFDAGVHARVSRYAVGWIVAHEESAALGRKLIEETYRRQGIEPDQLTLHADRGSSMTSKSVDVLPE